jgi:hypothetical protein
MKLTNQPHVPDDFDELVFMLQKHLSETPGPWFTANVDLKGAFMLTVPDPAWHNCRCCLQFLYRFGDIYTYLDGVPITLWSFPGMPVRYANMCKFLDSLVVQSIKPEDPLHVLPAVWGNQITGQFSHFLLKPAKTQTKEQADHYVAATERMQGAVENGFNVSNLMKLQEMAIVHDFPRQDKLMPQLDFMLKYLTSNTTGRRVILATAHDGLTHPRAGILDILIKSLMGGSSPESIKYAYTNAVDPYKYQRPTAAPKSGAIDQAEKLFASMGLASALERRPITVADVPDHAFLWRPTYKSPNLGVFGALRTQAVPAQVSNTTMTWNKFKKTVLPSALKLEWVKKSFRLTSLTTAVHSDAQPILRWDSPVNRNPVAWWIPFGLHSVGIGFSPVRGILKGVPSWSGDDQTLPHELLWLDLDITHYTYSGLFPECLRHELHGVRSVIEAHNMANLGTHASHKEASAITVSLQRDVQTEFTLRVTTANAVFNVTIDRLE